MNIWDIIAIRPISNVLIVLTHFLFNNFGLAVIALTIIFNLALLPLTLQQIRSSKAMIDIQPKLLDLQKKYANDKQKLAQEQQKLYKEAGMNPVGCLIPMLIQFPVWMALYGSISLLLALSPEKFVNLGTVLYSWPILYSTLPLNNTFLWANLATTDLALAILTGATMWIQQKMTPQPHGDPQQESQQRIMQYFMPLMFAYITFMFPSGLGLYFVTSNIFRIVLQYFLTGWGGLVEMFAGDDKSKASKKRK